MSAHGDGPNGPAPRNSRNRGKTRTTPWWQAIDHQSTPDIRSRRTAWLRTVGVHGAPLPSPSTPNADNEGTQDPA